MVRGYIWTTAMSYEQARKFLERIVPWPEQDEGFINLHYRQNKPMPNGKLPWRGAAAHGIDGIIRELDYRMKRVDTLDMYVCLSSQLEAKPWTKGGMSGMIAVRSKQNAVALRSFVIDVDVKATGYATPKDAMRAIAGFIRDTGLPMPTVMVASGTGGYHVYWAVDHNMTLDEWTPISQAMAEATKKFGFNVDTACTTDAARIMRVPETFNYKQTPRLPVVMGKFQEKDYDIDQIRNPLAMFMRDSAVLAGATGLHPSHSALKTTLTPIVGSSAVADNAELAIKYDPINIDRVAETCGFVDASLKNGGADNGGLAWNITTLIALFCENSVSDAHRMASGHKLYSSAETDDLIARKRSEKEKHGFGWPSCAAINAAGSKHCATCPNFGKSKSPVHFAVVPSVPVLSPIVAANGLAAPLPRFAHAAPIPDGYSQNNEGRVIYYKILPDGSIEKQIIYPFPMFGVWLQRNPLTLHFTTHVDGGREQAVAFPTLEFSTNDGLSRLLGKHAMFAKTAYSARFKEFLMAWVTRLQETRGGTVASSSFGWIVEEGVTKGFSYGGGLWSPRGKTLSCQPDPVISRQYSPKGQGKPWLQAAKMITGQRRAGLNAILASAFAAPLVMFTGQSGMLLSCFSQESGIGKSTTMKIAQSVWGNPVSAVQSLVTRRHRSSRRLAT